MKPDMYFLKPTQKNCGVLQVHNERGDVLSLCGMGTTLQMRELDITKWDASGMQYPTPDGPTDVAAFMQALGEHLGYLVLKDMPTHPFGGTQISHELHIEALGCKRPDTACILAALGYAGFLVVEHIPPGTSIAERQLHVWENTIPGPDDDINVVTIVVTVTSQEDVQLNWKKVEQAVRVMFPVQEVAVRSRIIVDTPNGGMDFAKKEQDNDSE